MWNSTDIYAHTVATDYRYLCNRARVQKLWSMIANRPTELLAYEDIRKEFGFKGMADHGLQEIPLESIVGSVGRYKDFMPGFLPKQNNTKDRWISIKKAMLEPLGMPPIEVYQVGESYFVIDGNHRVSVAREMGNPTITAYVTEVRTRRAFVVEQALTLSQRGTLLLNTAVTWYTQLMTTVDNHLQTQSDFAKRLLTNGQRLMGRQVAPATMPFLVEILANGLNG